MHIIKAIHITGTEQSHYVHHGCIAKIKSEWWPTFFCIPLQGCIYQHKTKRTVWFVLKYETSRVQIIIIEFQVLGCLMTPGLTEDIRCYV